MKPSRESDDGPTELSRLFEEALRCLENTDLQGANTALERACAEAASPHVDAEPPATHETRNASRGRGSLRGRDAGAGR